MVKCWVEEVAALGVEFEPVSETRVCKSRIEVYEEADPTFLEGIGILLGQTAMARRSAVRV